MAKNGRYLAIRFHLKCPATFEAWQNPDEWQSLKPQDGLVAAADGKPVKPASGAIAWNAYRKRWVTVFMQIFGKPSGFGEVWYAEADSPFGPWGPAVKVLSHKNYAFYNPAVASRSSHRPIRRFCCSKARTRKRSPIIPSRRRVTSTIRFCTGSIWMIRNWRRLTRIQK